MAGVHNTFVFLCFSRTASGGGPLGQPSFFQPCFHVKPSYTLCSDQVAATWSEQCSTTVFGTHGRAGHHQNYTGGLQTCWTVPVVSHNCRTVYSAPMPLHMICTVSLEQTIAIA